MTRTAIAVMLAVWLATAVMVYIAIMSAYEFGMQRGRDECWKDVTPAYRNGR